MDSRISQVEQINAQIRRDLQAIRLENAQSVSEPDHTKHPQESRPQ
jgi:hypothetical protein